jgi:hypothetical protein
MTSRLRPPRRAPRPSRQSRKPRSGRPRRPASANAKAYGGSRRPTAVLLARSPCLGPGSAAFRRVRPRPPVRAPQGAPARLAVPRRDRRRGAQATTRSALARAAEGVRLRPAVLVRARRACPRGPARPRCRRARAPHPCRASVPAVPVAAQGGPAVRALAPVVAADSAAVPVAVAAAVADSAAVPVAVAAADSAAVRVAVPVPVPVQASAVAPVERRAVALVVVVPVGAAAAAVPRAPSAVPAAGRPAGASPRSSADKSSTTCPRRP